MNRITCPLSASAKSFQEQTSLIEGDRRVTYGELDHTVGRLAGYLRSEGIEPGDRIALIDHNRLDYVIALFALFRLGAIACLFSHHMGKEALAELAVRCGCRLQISLPGSDLSLDKHVLPIIELPATSQLQIAATTGTDQIDLDRPATIMTTSGSTGAPKPVLHTYGNHYYNALGSNTNIPVEPGDRWLVSLSLYHVGGLAILFRCLLGGGTAVIAKPSDNLMYAIEQHGVTHISVVTTQLRRLLQGAAEDPDTLATLKAVLLGGGPAPRKLRLKAREAGLPLFVSYGLTEMASQVCTSPPGEPDVIRTLDYRQLKISGDNEILVKGATLFKGYIDSDGVTLPVDSRGWFVTGDTGKLDERGSLSVTGRKDNMFISGGENIHPEEIEHALLELDEVVETVVVPVSDDQFDFRPAAFVRLAEGESDLSEEQVRTRLLEGGLPRFKLPIAFFPWPKDLRTDRMKLSRTLFRERAAKLCSDG